MKILVIENEDKLCKEILFCLSVWYEQSSNVSADTGQKSIEIVRIELPDLIIADSSLPDIDILDFIIEIRQSSDVPLLILLHGENPIERARILEAGADDYLSKPFIPIELIARVKALLRRTYLLGYKHSQIFSLGKLIINCSTHQVLFDSKQIKLTPHEYNLLLELARNEGHVLSHSFLLEKVWGTEYAADYAFVKKYVYRLRSKLESDPETPRMLLSERGIGYRFVKPEE